ncbi:MAG: NAD(P)H-hydrate dehydratase [Elusimicrobiota bacterium]
MKLKQLSKKIAHHWFPQRKKKGHKGDFGRVLIIAGSRGMVGAAVLTSWGVIRSGVGLLRLVTVKSQQSLAMQKGPLEMTTMGVLENNEGQLSFRAVPLVFKILKQFKPDVVAIGPGLGQSKQTQKFIFKFLSSLEIPVVIDADALNALSAFKKKIKPKSDWILTPHEAEAARLLKVSPKRISIDRMAAVKEVSRQFKGTCLLKGSGTLISDGVKIYKNTTGNSGMASGGMGDVLTGIIASFWAQRLKQGFPNPLESASLGAYIHGLAGDILRRNRKMSGMIASDVAQYLPIVSRPFLKI